MIQYYYTGTEVQEWQGGDTKKQIAFCRGNKGFIAFNTDSEKVLEKKFQVRI